MDLLYFLHISLQFHSSICNLARVCLNIHCTHVDKLHLLTCRKSKKKIFALERNDGQKEMCGVAPIPARNSRDCLRNVVGQLSFLMCFLFLSLFPYQQKIVDGIFDGLKIKQIQKKKQSLSYTRCCGTNGMVKLMIKIHVLL